MWRMYRHWRPVLVGTRRKSCAAATFRFLLFSPFLLWGFLLHSPASYGGATVNAVSVPSGTITSAVTWNETSAPYYVDCNGVQIGAGGSLTIAAGVVVKFAATGCYSGIYTNATGASLVVNGT